jgi:SAM-dependent methyltransferase
MLEPGMDLFEQKLAAVWNAGGMAYDPLSRWVADAIEHAVSRLAPQAGETILDVATGTGWTARRIAQQGANVTGIDFASELIAAARRLAAAQDVAAQWQVADAQCLPFADHAFDAVISTFGVMFAARPELAARELARVCRPRGRLALVAWKPEGNVLDMFRVVQRHKGGPAASSSPSPLDWGLPERLHQLLGAAFDLHVEHGTNQLHLGDGEAAWEALVAGYGPVASVARAMQGPALHAFRRELVDVFERSRSGAGLTVQRPYLLAIGTRR